MSSRSGLSGSPPPKGNLRQPKTRREGYGRSPEASILLSQYSPLAKRNALVLVVGFALITLIGTLLLRLPIAGTERPLSWEEAFFTSTSATTVTGLSVITLATELSLFGQIVVLCLMEVGGVGFISFAVILFALIGRRIGIAERVLLQQSIGALETVGIARIALYLLAATSTIQLIGAFLLWLRWWPLLGAEQAAYQALFHSVSAFCNAGFDLYSGTGTVLFGYGRDPFTLVVLMALIIVGGLGFLVLLDLVSYPWDRRLTVHTKLTVLISVFLTCGGLAITLVDELYARTTLAQLPLMERFWVALFNVVSARTAGLTIIPLNEISQGSQLIIMVLMFIGGAPASMAGGVTISTVGVLIVTVTSTIRGFPQAVIFGRVLPFETIAKAAAIMTVSTLLCFFVTLFIFIFSSQLNSLFAVGFEVISAFSNTGYSLGVTTELNTVGRLLIAFTMFWGRLGPLTMVILLAQRERPVLARYPSERIVIG